MEQGSEDAAPAWGTLPVEQYLLNKWDRDSTLPIDQQRSQLVKAFIQEDHVATSLVPIATLQSDDMQQLILTVLVPWRSQQLRRIAQKHVGDQLLCHELVVLRTYYGGGAADDEKLREWLDEGDGFEESFGGPDNHWWRVLDDAALFDLDGGEWTDVYDVFPELAAPGLHRDFTDTFVDEINELVRTGWEEREPDEDDYEEAILTNAAISGSYRLIVDQQALEDNEFGLVFQDTKGNIIKEVPIPPNEVEYLQQYETRGALFESEYWLQGVVGNKYKTRGEIMRALLPRVMAGLE